MHVWPQARMEDRTTDAVRGRLFDADGKPKADSFKVNTISFKSLTWPSTAIARQVPQGPRPHCRNCYLKSALFEPCRKK